MTEEQIEALNTLWDPAYRLHGALIDFGKRAKLSEGEWKKTAKTNDDFVEFHKLIVKVNKSTSTASKLAEKLIKATNISRDKAVKLEAKTTIKDIDKQYNALKKAYKPVLDFAAKKKSLEKEIKMKLGAADVNMKAVYIYAERFTRERKYFEKEFAAFQRTAAV